LGAVEHLKTLCCLGLKPESAMVAVTSLLHEIIPHSWSRLALLAPDATITSTYAENPAMGPLFRERWRFMIHRHWFLYGSLRSALWASVGLCIGKVATTWKAAITGK
jgi:hypothetical protein